MSSYFHINRDPIHPGTHWRDLCKSGRILLPCQIQSSAILRLESKARDMRKVFLGLIVLLLAACATSNNGNSLLDTVSQESKIESAREDFTEKIEELTESGGLLADPQLAERVRQIAGKLVAATVSEWPHTENWDWSIALVDDPEENLLSVFDGGFIFLDRELFDSIEPSDDELAFLIAFAIVDSVTSYQDAYVAHSVFSSLGVIALHAALGPAGGLVSGLGYDAYLARINSRLIMLEMDEISMRLVLATGFDPAAAVSFVNKSVAWREREENNRYLFDYLNQILIADYVMEERIANIDRLLTEFSELTPEAPPPPYPVRMYYEFSE